jgi:predicted regulator of Ras-like GTPase activity (Roadblock/LC7/MglB family)
MLYGNANLQSAYRFKLREVISEMREGGDIEGAVLVNENNDIIVSAFSKSTDVTLENHEIMALIEAMEDPDLGKTQDVFFTQRIFDYKGLKVLAKKIKDRLTLLVILKKPGYISLAMLDIENSTRRIHEILFGYSFKRTPN